MIGQVLTKNGIQAGGDAARQRRSEGASTTVLIYSAGGYAREFRRLLAAETGQETVFIDDNATGDAISYEQARHDYPGARLVIGFADGALRRSKTKQARDDGFQIIGTVAGTAIIGERCTLGPGAILSDYSIITADAKIGESFHCNIYSYVAHDCEVGDFVTLAPRVSVNGRVVIEDEVYVGTGATILPGRKEAPMRIGRGAVIGAHALVTRNVPAGATVVGAPAKPMARK